MLVKGIASIGVVASVTGLLWSTTPEPMKEVPASSAGIASEDGHRASAHRDFDRLRDIESQIQEKARMVREKISALREQGRQKEAEELEQIARQRYDEARSLREQLGIHARELAGLPHEGGRDAHRDVASRYLEKLLEGEGGEHLHQERLTQLHEHLQRAHEEMAEFKGQGRFEEARRQMAEALELTKLAEGEHLHQEHLTQLHEHLQRAHEEMAEFKGQGRFEEARRQMAEALELTKLAEGEHPHDPHQMHGMETLLEPTGIHQELLLKHVDEDKLIELHEHLNRVREQAEALHEHGEHEDAGHIDREAEELMVVIEQLGRRGHEAHMDPDGDFELQKMLKHMTHLESGLVEHHERGDFEAADGLKREIEELQRVMEVRARGVRGIREEDEPHPMHAVEEVQRKAHHMLQAAENLAAAGMGDHADELRKHAEEVRRHAEEMLIQAERQHGGGEFEGDHDERFEILKQEIHELRGDVHELMDMVRELHHRLDELTA